MHLLQLVGVVVFANLVCCASVTTASKFMTYLTTWDISVLAIFPFPLKSNISKSSSSFLSGEPVVGDNDNRSGYSVR